MKKEKDDLPKLEDEIDILDLKRMPPNEIHIKYDPLKNNFLFEREKVYLLFKKKNSRS